MAAAIAAAAAAVGSPSTPQPPQPSISGTWRSSGGDEISVVVASPGTFAASSGRWTDAPGNVTADGSLSLGCCAPGGVRGVLRADWQAIQWGDPAVGVWSRPSRTVAVQISNTDPQRDADGGMLNIGDGCVSRFADGLYYRYGVRYQCCPVSEQPRCYGWPVLGCGWSEMTFAVYTSPDLQNWTLASDNIFPYMTEPLNPNNAELRSYFEPCVLYNRKHNHYALWFNHPIGKGTAVSSSPFGPFTLAHWDVGLPQGTDVYFWIDQDSPNDVYAKHNAYGRDCPNKDNVQCHMVKKLSDDWLSVELNATSNAMVPPATPVPQTPSGSWPRAKPWPECTEGGGIFAYKQRWYVQFGYCCCFCQSGSNAITFVSEDGPLGPYVYSGDAVAWNASDGHYTTRSQQFSVAPLYTTDGVLPMWIGQQWGSADDGLKCHDRRYWAPMEFEEDGRVKPMPWVDRWTVDLQLPAAAAGSSPV